jgi:hypothetical protein
MGASPGLRIAQSWGGSGRRFKSGQPDKQGVQTVRRSSLSSCSRANAGVSLACLFDSCLPSGCARLGQAPEGLGRTHQA